MRSALSSCRRLAGVSRPIRARTADGSNGRSREKSDARDEESSHNGYSVTTSRLSELPDYFFFGSPFFKLSATAFAAFWNASLSAASNDGP